MSEQVPSKEISEARLLNTRAWARARPDMSGSEVIVAAIDELLARRAAHEPSARHFDVNYQPAMVFAVRELLGSLPKSRDWFNPDAERVFREFLSDARQHTNVGTAQPPEAKRCWWPECKETASDALLDATRNALTKGDSQ
jgi:hypothetical protein